MHYHIADWKLTSMLGPSLDLVKVMAFKKAIKRASAQCKGNESISVQGVQYIA